MDNQTGFFLKCPDFDVYYPDTENSEKQTGLCVQKSNYAHPIDSKIIDVLDMPGIYTVFGSAVDMLTDLSYSQIISSGIPVNRKNFPEIDEIVNHCVAVLGIKKPYVVVSNAIALNALTVGSDEEPCIVLGNMLVRVMDPVKLTFVIGHECGHIAMGHVVYHTVVSTAGSFSRTIPLLGPLVYKSSAFALNAWSRRSEITADRAGLLCCLDVDAAQKALLQLQSGFISANQLDLNNFIQTSKQYRRKSILRRVNEFLETHPPLSKRIEALDLFAQSDLYYTAQGLNIPANCISEHELTKSVEHIIAVLGEE
ncbi:MAG: M48 family metallopeptidase [Eubacteriales bacterium]|nr:M48 family metallopeptidase [Eubacteriales bacterium]